MCMFGMFLVCDVDMKTVLFVLNRRCWESSKRRTENGERRPRNNTWRQCAETESVTSNSLITSAIRADNGVL